MTGDDLISSNIASKLNKNYIFALLFGNYIMFYNTNIIGKLLLNILPSYKSALNKFKRNWSNDLFLIKFKNLTSSSHQILMMKNIF